MSKVTRLLVAAFPAILFGGANLYMAVWYPYPPGLMTNLFLALHWFFVVFFMIHFLLVMFIFPVPKKRRRRK